MTSTYDVDKFRRLLTEATAAVRPDYFMLPVADVRGDEMLIHYRERVYAYEVYHQLRSRWPDWLYSLGGEVDKSRHPIVRGPDLDRAKPDLLVHVPGDMEHNLVVIEIKPASPEALPSERAAIDRDLRKVAAFRSQVRYAAGILLVFGEAIVRILQHARESRSKGVDLTLIELWHHPRPGCPARRVPWDGDAA